jgi:hypothetical protein
MVPGAKKEAWNSIDSKFARASMDALAEGQCISVCVHIPFSLWAQGRRRRKKCSDRIIIGLQKGSAMMTMA